jgi:hypothetical protein
MFALSFRTVSPASILFTLVAGALAVACGGAPEEASDAEHADSTLAPSSCHGAANADGLVGISCDTFSPVATAYSLERLDDGAWVPIEGPSNHTPDLTDEGTSDSPANNPAPPSYPQHYRVRASVPVGVVYSAPIEVAAPQ